MKLKKVLSAILATAMVLSTMSFTVFAEEKTVSNDAELAAALAAATEGDVITLKAGTYESFFVDVAGITIKGEDENDKPVIKTNYEDSATNTPWPSSGGVCVRAENTTFENLAFESEGNLAGWYSACIGNPYDGKGNGKANGTKILNCDFNCDVEDFGGTAIILSSATDITVSGCTITGFQGGYAGEGTIKNATINAVFTDNVITVPEGEEAIAFTPYYTTGVEAGTVTMTGNTTNGKLMVWDYGITADNTAAISEIILDDNTTDAVIVKDIDSSNTTVTADAEVVNNYTSIEKAIEYAEVDVELQIDQQGTNEKLTIKKVDDYSYTDSEGEKVALYEATVTDGDVVTKYNTLEEAFDAANKMESATIDLVSDVVLEERVSVSGNVTLYGNGHTIGYTYKSVGDYASISIGGTLNLGTEDGGDKNILTLTSAEEDKSAVNLLYLQFGTVNMYDGVSITDIYEREGDSGIGAPVFMYQATFNMYGGSITDCSDDGEGYFTYAGAVFLDSHSEFNMFGGKISDNSAKSGGGIMANNNCTINISGGEISNNTATEGGAALSGWSNNVFNITGGTIEGNKAETGAAVSVSGSDLNISGGTIIKNTSADGEGSIAYKNAETVNITGGTFDEKLADEIIPDGYFFDEITNTVMTVDYVVINTVSATAFDVSINNLMDSIEGSTFKGETEAIVVDNQEKATYAVVLNTASEEDIEAAKAAEGFNAINANTTEAIDITIVKTKDGVEKEIDLKNKEVTIILNEAAEAGSEIEVWHVTDEGDVEKIDTAALSEDGKEITFVATSFSTYLFNYSVAAVDENTVFAEKLEVRFDKITDTEYNIVVASADENTIHRLTSADLTFVNDVENGAVAYTVVPATNVVLTERENGRYMFNFDGVNDQDASGSKVTLGRLILEGYGKGSVKVNTSVDTNLVNTTTAVDNIVEHYVASGSAEFDGKELTFNETGASYEIEVPKSTLRVDVNFNNIVGNNVVAYQNMKATITGGDLTETITYDFGSDNSNVMFDAATCTYTFMQSLTQNRTYTVTISGAGYRTAKYTVTMTRAKTLTFWNNVLDADNAITIETDSDAAAVTKNFLAGDIVKDGQINIYDLSAVVSYFGDEIDVNTYNEYAKYDLNRDGKINSKDVAYVLVSWGE